MYLNGRDTFSIQGPARHFLILGTLLAAVCGAFPRAATAMFDEPGPVYVDISFTDNGLGAHSAEHPPMLDIFESFPGVGLTGSSPALDHGFPFTAAVVPIPPAVWLFASAVGALGFMRRKQRNRFQ